MPDFLSWLKKPLDYPEQTPEQEAEIRHQQALMPKWKQAGQSMMDVLPEAVKGLLGIDPDSLTSNAGYVANALTSMGSAGDDAIPGFLKAGIPLSKAFPEGKLFHGSPNNFERFNPAQNNSWDLLGRYTHFTPSPEYADKFATKGYSTQKKSNILRANIKADNILDLTGSDVPSEDIARLVSVMPRNDRAILIDRVRARNRGDTGYFNDGSESTKASDIQHFLNQEGMPEKLPFDGIKYQDFGDDVEYPKHALAVPPQTSIKSYYGNMLMSPERMLSKPPIRLGPSNINIDPITGQPQDRVDELKALYDRFTQLFTGAFK